MNSVLFIILAFVATIAFVDAAPVPIDTPSIEDQDISSASPTQYYSTWDYSRLDAIFDTVGDELNSLVDAVDLISDITISAPSVPSDGWDISHSGPAYTTWGPSQFESFMGSDFSWIASFYPDYTPTGQYGDSAGATSSGTEAVPTITSTLEEATTPSDNIGVGSTAPEIYESVTPEEYATTTTEESSMEYVSRCSH
ncbi:hypothetical protein LPJ59_005969 [Coemansia sp. RSA 2399]|nr:hypothetical protein LPJ59_005969 [Coemansia sp. RSA 2399]KAJ1890739.1 hypothetical protein LPJ81_005882 [Coemansia sp. IMI 209127]